MEKEEIFKNLFDECYFKLNELTKEIDKIKETDISAGNGYELALKDFKKILSEIEDRKDLYLNK